MRTVAVVTPIYATPENGRLELLHQTLMSIVHQQDSNYSLVYLVVDDGSTSDVEGFLKSYNDSRIRYIRRERSPSDLKTASNALNLGIDLCLTRDSSIFTMNESDDLYSIAFLHSDDLLTKDSIKTRLEYLGEGFVHTDMAFFNNKGNVIRVKKWKAESDKEYILAVGTHILFNHHTIMWELGFLRYLKDFVAREYEQPGVFDPLLSHGEDRDMSLSSAEAAIEGNYEIRHISAVSVFYRCHQNSITGESAEPDYLRAQRDRIFQKHFGWTQPKRLIPDLLVRLQADPPWSWGTFLPEGAKRRLRPVRNYVRGLRSENLYPRLSMELQESLYQHDTMTLPVE